MSNPLHEILKNYEGVIDQELLLRYVSGNANHDENLKVEQMFGDDPFLADAIEGLKMDDLKLHVKNISTINKDIRQLTKTDGGQISRIYPYLGIAASIVLIVLISFFVFSPKGKYSQKNIVGVALPGAGQVVKDKEKVVPEITDTTLDKVNFANVGNVTRDGFQKSKIKNDDISINANNNTASKAYYKISDTQILASSTLKEEIDVERKSEIMSKGAEPAAAEMEELDFDNKLIESNGYSGDLLAMINYNKSFVEEAEWEKIDYLKDPIESNKREFKKKGRCLDCPSQGKIRKENLTFDTILSRRADLLEKNGDYDQAGYLHRQKNDLKSLLKSGLAFILAKKWNQVIEVEDLIKKHNSNSSNYLRGMRFVAQGNLKDGISIFEKLRNVPEFKEISIYNLESINYK